MASSKRCPAWRSFHPPKSDFLREVGDAVEDFKRANLTETQERAEAQHEETVLWHPPPAN
jgi:hypothetical protein